MSLRSFAAAAPCRFACVGALLGLGVLPSACRKGEAGSKRGSEVDPSHLATAKVTYQGLCAKCHGADGSGGVVTAGTAPRKFSDAAFQASRTDVDLAQAIRLGKGAMPAFGAIYDQDQIAALVAVIRDFNPEKK